MAFDQNFKGARILVLKEPVQQFLFVQAHQTSRLDQALERACRLPTPARFVCMTDNLLGSRQLSASTGPLNTPVS